ncbi:hypothetical protein [Halobacteriovorax sp.]|uniref:hypothetical protein n=1 Tax=Halobacteriovorax sp. TaxID=2020862 RepID=UPI003565817E
MKTILLTSFIISSILNISAREVSCVVNDVYAPYSDIFLKKEKGNKYRMVVSKEGEELIDETVSYSFSRRGRNTVFRNKETELKTQRLVINKGVRALFVVPQISKLSYTGLCKLHKN